MENKSIEEIAAMKKNFLNTSEVAAVLGISPATFRNVAVRAKSQNKPQKSVKKPKINED